MSYLAMLFASWGAKHEITLAAPDYAGRLYFSALDQMFGQWPIRSVVLFREEPPAKASEAIRLLRGIYLVHWLLFVAFLLTVAVLVISAAAA